MQHDAGGENYEEIFNARGHLYNEAGSIYPLARNAERAALIERLDVHAGHVVCDVPAGGGYLADGIRRAFGQSVKVICVEPAVKFACAIHPDYAVRHDPMSAMSLADESINRLGSLAGLHHVEDRLPVYREWYRVLKPAGRIAAADVQWDTGAAGFLNCFVHDFTPGGHEGVFFHPGDWTRELGSIGFIDIREELIDVPWVFPNAAAMQSFCQTLFATSKATPAQVSEAIEHYLGTTAHGDHVSMHWSLRYVSAQKPNC